MATVDLRWNEIGPGGAAAIVAMLQRNHSLTEIRLVGNGIPPSIQAQIDELLEKNRQGKLFQPAGPPLDGHPFPEPNIGLVSLNSVRYPLTSLFLNYNLCDDPAFS